MAHKESNRPRRVAELLKRELALIIPRELDHPLARRITLTYAEAPRDLSSVRIYFTLLENVSPATATGVGFDDGLQRRAPTSLPGVVPPPSMASSPELKDAAQALNHAAGFLRHRLRGRVVLRAIPELRFHYDESVARGARLTGLIDRAIREDQEHPQDD